MIDAVVRSEGGHVNETRDAESENTPSGNRDDLQDGFRRSIHPRGWLLTP